MKRYMLNYINFVLNIEVGLALIKKLVNLSSFLLEK